MAPPERLAVGRGTAFAIGGYAYSPAARTRSLAIRVGDALQPVARYGLPRDDIYGRLDQHDPARPLAYRSGFVSVVDLPPVARVERRELELVLTLAGGGEARTHAGMIEVLPRVQPPDDAPTPDFPGGGSRVAICMATFEPPPDLLRIQLDSLREQTHGNWICLISDDSSSDEAFRRLLALTDGDPRFAVSRSAERLGFYRNFERAVSMAPAAADFVTLCDQDDRWRPDKLERLLGA